MTRQPDLPRTLNAALLRRWPLPALEGVQGKDDRGRVLVVGGSRQIPGSVLLTAEAALRAGAGKLQIATARSVASTLALHMSEARVIDLPESKDGELTRAAGRAIRDEADRCDALIVGPGMRAGHAAPELVRHCVLGPRLCPPCGQQQDRRGSRQQPACGDRGTAQPGPTAAAGVAPPRRR